MSKLRFASSLTATAFAGALPLLFPSAAQACGGTFCDQGPQTMPVDQTGENILFHIGEDTVQAHIQIQYDPEAEADKFAWVIPVTSLPTFSVGSQLLFDAMLNASVPSYGLTQSNEFCGDDGADDVGSDDEGGWGDEVGEGTEGGEENGVPDVVLETTVGAFDISVLDGGSVEGVMTWLNDNGYQQDPAAMPILEEYLADGHLFVALKLTNDAEVGEIHPITLTYDGTESCVPIKLTRIAAVEDMEIRVFFLQDARTVPVNYRHVLVNPLKIDWFNNAINYKEVISLAVDADMANGNAFVTEYAGPSAVISPDAVHQNQWQSEPLAALTDSPIGVIQTLTDMALMSCAFNDGESETCSYAHPLLEGLLAEFIPVPADVSQIDFYECLTCYEEQIDAAAWDAVTFAERVEERIVQPGQTARVLLDANPYLTRMYTTISPAEMNADPVFRVNSTLSEVPNQRLASQVNLCNGSAEVTLPDGRVVVFPDQNPIWPDFPDEMPFEEDVDQENMAEDTPLISLVDNTELIDALLENHNDEVRSNIPGADDGAATDSGCSCSTQEDEPGGALFGFAALGLLGLGLRRKR